MAPQGGLVVQDCDLWGFLHVSSKAKVSNTPLLMSSNSAMNEQFAWDPK